MDVFIFSNAAIVVEWHYLSTQMTLGHSFESSFSFFYILFQKNYKYENI